MLDATGVIQQAREAARQTHLSEDWWRLPGDTSTDAAVRVVLQELRERFPARVKGGDVAGDGRLIAAPELHRAIDELLKVLDA